MGVIRVNDVLQSSYLMERIRGLGSIIGQMFAGNRDLYKVYGYKASLSYQDFLNKFARQDIAARIVEAEPKATWSDGIKMMGDEAFISIWQDIVSRHSLYHNLIRVDKLAGLGKYAILLIGYDDGSDLESPVAASNQETEGDQDTQSSEVTRQVLYLQPYSEVSTKIVEFETDPRNPRFNMPRIYEISPDPAVADYTYSQNRQDIKKAKPFRVHHSRVIHVAENMLENSVYGYPRLQRVYNLLDDLAKMSGGSAETFWLTANRGMQIDVDKDMDLRSEDMEDLAEEVDEYQHNLRRVLRTRGVKVNMLGSDVADPRGTFQVLIALISGATGIPQRILLGSEAGQLASEQDRANWAVRISERRTEYAEPVILIPLIRALINAGALPRPQELTILWPEAFKMSPLERAQTAAQKARTLANVAKALTDGEGKNSPISREEGRAIIGIEETTPIFDSPSDTATIR